MPKREHSQASWETEKNKAEEKLSLYVTLAEQTLRGWIIPVLYSELSVICGLDGADKAGKPRGTKTSNSETQVNCA